MRKVKLRIGTPSEASMKCEHCDNEMSWVGSLQSGRMTCYHCALTGVGEAYVTRARNDPVQVTVGGGGGVAGKDPEADWDD
jgi:ribosomal protein L37AE/L43A